MGVVDPVSLDEAMEHPGRAARTDACQRARAQRRCELTVVLVAAAIFLTGILGPPSLMDDVDSTQVQIARNMLGSGDWVTARLALVVEDKAIPRIEALVGGASLHLVRASGGKSLFSNREPAVAARARRP